jgi:hypothetical protein
VTNPVINSGHRTSAANVCRSFSDTGSDPARCGIQVVLSGVRMPQMDAIMERWVQTLPCTVLKLAARSVGCGFAIGSGRSSIFVDHSAQDAMSVDWGIDWDDVGGIVVGRAVLAALMRAGIIKVSGELVQDQHGVAFELWQVNVQSTKVRQPSATAEQLRAIVFSAPGIRTNVTTVAVTGSAQVRD